MKNYKALSAILGGTWLIEPMWAQANLPQVMAMLSNEPVNFPGAHTKQLKAEELAMNLSDMAVGQGTTSTAAAYRVGLHNDLGQIPAGSVGVVSITGPITKYGGMSSYGTMDYIGMINRAAKSENIAGILLDLDTPGGEAAGIAQLSDEILSARQKKPVIVFVNNGMAASAGMWIAASADEIILSQQTDRVGSIGVMTTLADYKQYFESQGLKIHTIYSRLSGEKNDDYNKAMIGEYDGIKDGLDILANAFISTVASNRHGAQATKEKWSKGRMFFAEEAIAVKLADRIGTYSEAVEAALGASNNQAGISQNQQSMNFFGKKSACNKLVSTAQDERTEDLFTAANAELSEAGLCLVNSNAEEFESAQAAQETELADANNEITQLKADLSTAKADAQTWKETAKAYGKQPGDKPTTVVSKDKSPEASDKQEEAQMSDVEKEAAELQALMSGANSISNFNKD